jgi:hypothetical protein
MRPTVEVDPSLQPLVEQAIVDLAGKLSIEPSQIDLSQFESVVWPDSSLGCPQPGMEYLQVLMEGYRILLRAGGQVYAYHGGGNRGPFLCKNPAPAATID